MTTLINKVFSSWSILSTIYNMLVNTGI